MNINGTKRNLLVTLADKNFVDQVKQLFSSVYWNAAWEGDYMLLAHEIPDEELEWFRRKNILIKKCTPFYTKSLGKNEHPPVVLDKFYLFTPEFKKWDKIIYLDSDIIVRGTINKMINVANFSGVLSTLTLKNQFDCKSVLNCELKNKYKFNKKTFCTGIFSFSTDIINDHTFSDIITLFERYKDIVLFAEEGILNLFFHNKWVRLPIIYGLDVSFLTAINIKYEQTNALVLHFVRIENYENAKPWHPDNAFNSEWLNNLKRADAIDLNIKQKPNKWSSSKCLYYTVVNNFFFFYIKHFKFIYQFRQILNRLMGKAGVILKKNNPNLYLKLKKIFNKSWKN